MPEVDFYLSSEQGHNIRLSLACRLVEKAYNLGHSIYVHTDSAAHADELDDLLWTFKQNSFIPHALCSAAADPAVADAAAPVLVGWQERPRDHTDILLNLASRVPPFFCEFARVLEVVDQNPENLAQSRARFRSYREQNCEPRVNRL